MYQLIQLVVLIKSLANTKNITNARLEISRSRASLVHTLKCARAWQKKTDARHESNIEKLD